MLRVDWAEFIKEKKNYLEVFNSLFSFCSYAHMYIQFICLIV